jgi:hypothetical protein
VNARSGQLASRADPREDMIKKPRSPRLSLTLIFLLALVVPACTPETVEVTRIKIMERRVIERVIVTVEVTRIQQIVVTPKPTSTNIMSPGVSPTAEASPSPPPSTPTSASRPTAAGTTPPATSARKAGESLLATLEDTEQTLLPLVHALNSDPLPVDEIIALYGTIRGAPTLAIPEDAGELQSMYARYRDQIDNVLGQSTDLLTHLSQIQSGQANQTEVRPTDLALAREAASAATSTVEGLMREVEAYLDGLP